MTHFKSKILFEKKKIYRTHEDKTNNNAISLWPLVELKYEIRQSLPKENR